MPLLRKCHTCTSLFKLCVNEIVLKAGWQSSEMLVPGWDGQRQQSVRSSCSSFCSPPAPRWWVRWDWTGSQHWWSHGSPLCWPPSYGSLEIMERKKQPHVCINTSKKRVEVRMCVWKQSDWTPIPVRTSLKAASTLVESNADVSMNIRPLFSGLVITNIITINKRWHILGAKY